MAPAPIRLLLIDDSPEDLAVYCHWLYRAMDDEGLVIVHAELGAEGLEQARVLSPDCILLDFLLPDGDGLAWLSAYHKMAPDPAPVIVLTGYANEDLALDVIRAGADDYLQKFDLTAARLVFVVRRAIEHTRMRRAREEADALLRAVLAAAPLGVAFFDCDLRFCHVNPRLATINQIAPEAHIGRRVEEVVPDLAAAITPSLAEVLATRQPILNSAFQRADPTTPTGVRHWQTSYFPVHTAEDRLLGVGAMILEVTERVRAEAALSRFAARTALIAEAAEAFAATRLDASAIFRILTEHLTTHAGDRCLIWRLGADRLDYELVDGKAADAAYAQARNLPGLQVAQLGDALQDGQPLRLSVDQRVAASLSAFAEALGVCDLLALPIAAHGETFGFALVGRSDVAEPFSDAELLVASELARRAALSLSNTVLLEQVRMAEVALRQANDTLEARVVERTAALLAREQQLHRALAEKEVLLKEVHHRVKNNLQVIISLLRLQIRRGVGDLVAAQLSDTQQRIYAMALVHEQLYVVGDLGRIDLATYVEQLLTHLLRSYTGQPDHVATKLTIPDALPIPLDVAIPLGLILTELLTNSLKYAFPDGRLGTLEIAATMTNDELRLRVSDDGVGFAPNTSLIQSRGMGGQLVRQLAQQLCGSVTALPEPGAVFEICLPYAQPETGTH